MRLVLLLVLIAWLVSSEAVVSANADINLGVGQIVTASVMTSGGTVSLSDLCDQGCEINWLDLQAFCEAWLTCTVPYGEGCIIVP